MFCFLQLLFDLDLDGRWQLPVCHQDLQQENKFSLKKRNVWRSKKIRYLPKSDETLFDIKLSKALFLHFSQVEVQI